MSERNPFVWHELVTSEPSASGEFYAGLLGWRIRTVDAGEYGSYTLFEKDGEDVAGMMAPTPDTPGEGSYWHSYIAVDDVDYCVKRAVELGGEVLVQAHDIAGVGRICAVADPSGAIVHLMQPERA